MSIVAAASAALQGCAADAQSNKATSDNPKKVERAEETNPQQIDLASAAYAPVVKLTRDKCVALATKAEKIACMRKLQEQQKAEIAAKTDALEKVRNENAELETTIDGLTQVVALQEGEKPPQ